MIDRRSVTISGVQSVDPVGFKAQSNLLDNIADSLYNVSENLEKKAINAGIRAFNTTATQRLSEIYKDNSSNPEVFNKIAGDYLKAFTQKMPTPVKNEVSNKFKTLQDKYSEKAISNRGKLVDNESQFQIALANNQLLERTSELSTGFFGNQLDRTTAFNNLLDGIEETRLNYSTLGEDGLPLYTAEQRLNAQNEFTFTVLKNAAREGLATSDNPLEFLEDISSNNFEIPAIEGLTTEPIKLSVLLPVDKVEQLGKDLEKELKDKFDLGEKEKNARKQQDALDAFNFENNFNSAMASGNKLTIDDVASSRDVLDADQYTKYYTLASTVAPNQSNNISINRLRQQQANGIDVSEDLLVEYANGNISDADYVDLETGNQSMQGKPIDPISGARNSFKTLSSAFVDPITGMMEEKKYAAMLAKAESTFNTIISKVVDSGQELSYNDGYNIALYSIASNMDKEDVSLYGIKLLEPEVKITNMPDGTRKQEFIYPDIAIDKAIKQQRENELISKYQDLLNTDNVDIIVTDENFKKELDKLDSITRMFK